MKYLHSFPLSFSLTDNKWLMINLMIVCVRFTTPGQEDDDSDIQMQHLQMAAHRYGAQSTGCPVILAA